MVNKKRRGLGRGLDALFQDAKKEEQNFAPKIRRADEIVSQTSEERVSTRVKPRAPRANEAASNSSTKKIAIEKLHPGKFQPRRNFKDEAISNLAESIKTHGILQPLLVRAMGGGDFEIIAGERRWRASQKAQIHELPVVVVDFDDKTALEVALIENLQREDLSSIEEAEGYQRLINEFNHTQEDLAKNLGKSRSSIANSLRLLKLPNLVKSYVDNGSLSASHARTLVGCANAANIAKSVVKRGLSVRQTEKLVKQTIDGKLNSTKSSTKKAKTKDVDILALEEKISSLLGIKVLIEGRGAEGKLILEYKSFDQLDDILERLSNNS